MDIAGAELASMSPIRTELDFVVKEQIEELKVWGGELTNLAKTALLSSCFIGFFTQTYFV